MSVQRLRDIVNAAVPALFAQIQGGRVVCESEASLQLHLGRVITTVADLAAVTPLEAFSIELEKPLRGDREKRGEIDIWFRLTDDAGIAWRCAMELKFFKRANHREPNNRYDVFKDMLRLEGCKDVADIGYMLVATDHTHYIDKAVYALDTQDFDFRDGRTYKGGTELVYRKATPYGDPITLKRDYRFEWAVGTNNLRYMLLEVRVDD
ncbi:hypothetical protein ASF00_09295 [Sphingomonas sp. Leaf34]|uniref:hypothetical protein n=1 Tax=Sphingomonas sp. Leaf34 TaxID=1736216 RepID=UPI0006F87F45|nr:hypothetical protein [Sphingomonas sp. Leaf34]KQN28093.1 hypothetical protein ASF00_09295 [Sphingomonas sp. Leaf34]